jgi:hypothetical protein
MSFINLELNSLRNDSYSIYNNLIQKIDYIENSLISNMSFINMEISKIKNITQVEFKNNYYYSTFADVYKYCDMSSQFCNIFINQTDSNMNSMSLLCNSERKLYYKKFECLLFHKCNSEPIVIWTGGFVGNEIKNYNHINIPLNYNLTTLQFVAPIYTIPEVKDKIYLHC